MSIKHGHIRWAFDLKGWHCTLNELELAIACIQPEEKKRLAQFHFIDDFKSSIVGRLLMRRFVKACLPELDYNGIHLERDSRGKPFFKPPPGMDQIPKIDFNVSHHERYAVIAGSFTTNHNQIDTQTIGVDVMNTVYTGGKPIDEFFRLMQRTFTPNEWRFIRARSNEQQQSAAFMRHWCLKESYAKNIGVGITMDLQSIDFKLKTDDLAIDHITRDTVVSVGRQLQRNWIFEESLLDDDHCVAVAVENPTKQYLDIPQNELLFQIIDFKMLMEDAIKIRPSLTIDTNYCRRVMAKELKRSV